MKGSPVSMTIWARLAPAPEAFSTAPNAPPAEVMNTMGPASFRVVSMIFSTFSPPIRFPKVRMARSAPIARAMLASPIKEVTANSGCFLGSSMAAVVFPTMSSRGITRGMRLARVPGRSSVLSSKAASSSFCASGWKW